jgi:hypothetical protein
MKLRGANPVPAIRRLAIASAAAVAVTAVVALLPGGTAARAVSLARPAITVADGNSVIAEQTGTNGLRFYWNEHGTPIWHSEQVAPDGTTFSNANVAQVGSYVVIAAQGADNSLDFYWQQNGGTGWHMQTVAGSGTSWFMPSIMADGSAVVIAEQGAGNSLAFFWTPSVGSRWHPETVAGSGTTFSVPALTVNGNSVNIAAEGPSNSLDFYWAVNGSPTWNPEVVAGPGSIASAPAMTVNQGSVNIAALNFGGLGTEFYWAVNGSATWHQETLPGFDSGAPAITTYPGGVHVVNTTFFAQVGDSSTANGTGTWQWTPVSGAEHTATYAVVTENDGVENIAFVGADGNLYFYWQADDGFWVRELVDTAANL